MAANKRTEEMEDYGEWIADRARIRQQVAAKGQQHPKQKRAAEKGNGSKQKEQVNPAQVLISNGPTLSMHEDKVTQLLREEEELRRQLDELAQSIKTCDKAREKLRLEQEECLQTLRQEVERLEREEDQCQAEIADLTAKMKAAKQRSADRSVRKEQAEIVNPDIPEEFELVLERLRAENSALEKELEEREHLSASLIVSQAALSAAKQLLGLAREELSEASTKIDSRARMRELVKGQRNRILLEMDLKKRLVDLVGKRRLVLLDIDAEMNPKVVK